MTLTSGALDSGLLSPVHAGTPVEAETSDAAWLRAMVEAETGLVRVQARLGTVPEWAAAAITEAARPDRLDLVGIARAARETANPVVGFVAALTAAVAAADTEGRGCAEYVHRGSTSQDILDTASMLVTRRALAHVLDDLDRCAATLSGLAREHRDTPMAGRTLGLHAVPTTFGLKAAGWLHLVRQARARLGELARTGLLVSIGGAAGTLAGYLEYAGHGWSGDTAPSGAGAYTDALVAGYAEELGLAVPVVPWHTLRTPVADIAGAAAFLTGALGKIAADVQSLARTEVAELGEPAVAGRGASSAMPHKRNPVLATLIRSAALQMPQLAATLYGTMLTEDERSGGAWHAEWQPLRSALRMAGGAAHVAAELLEGLEVHAGRMRSNLEMTDGQIVSERIAAVLTPAFGRGEARRLLTEASAEASASGRSLDDVLGKNAEVAGRLSAHELAALVDPAHYTGAAGHLTDRVLAQAGGV
ncbi:adenylosuccinate lyase family protein [Streptomyces sp. NPDC102282]|uniref:class-II fumarase/aspartase family protein n=1 Tax=Streptomyces sp. NPDC102282 TaxID=3366154 RepID=UPI0037FE15CB